MGNSKFHELCMAYTKAQQGFQSFEDECHLLAINMVDELKKYFEIPDSQFSLFKINEKGEFNLVQPGLVNALSLRPDSRWHFGIGLTVCSAPETLPQELILIQILIRQDLDGNFFLKYGDLEREFKMEKAGERNFTPFFDYIHSEIINVYENHMTHFIGEDTERKIGY